MCSVSPTLHHLKPCTALIACASASSLHLIKQMRKVHNAGPFHVGRQQVVHLARRIQIAAAHVQVTYFAFSDKEYRALIVDQGPGSSLGRQPAAQGRLTDSPVLNYLKGGVLVVQLRKAIDLVHKPLHKGGLLPACV